MSILEKKELTDGDIDAWFDNADISMLDDGTSEVDGYKVSVDSYTSCHSDHVDVTITFINFGVTIETRGYKEISYDRWVDTDFNYWEYA